VRILVCGGGGREHALCAALAGSPSVTAVLCAPGNPGIAELAECCEADPSDAVSVVSLGRDRDIDLVIIGPEAPLVAGVADALTAEGIPVLGPTREAARIESSKAFAKEVMAAAGVATADCVVADEPGDAEQAFERFAPPYVVKADGLAAGKGVRVCATREEATTAIEDAMVRRAFGEAGGRLVVEEHLDGPEASLMAVSDGDTVVPLAPAQDYKRVYDGDAGANTGGMGSYSPVPALDERSVAELTERALAPTVAELSRRGLAYRGVLYAGLVLTAAGPKVLEFNARLGDPEAQAVLPRLRSDFGEVAWAAAVGGLRELSPLAWSSDACVTVVMASAGYPASSERGKRITGLETAAESSDVCVFQAGTRAEGAELVTDGGRVLGVDGLGDGLAAARASAYRGVEAISFEGAHFRRDIAAAPLTTTPA
jgi:phosphoribosylamine--glycine ligase